MSIVTITRTLLAIYPVIQDIIVSVEEAASNAGNSSGAAKKAMAVALVKTVYDASNPAVPFDTLRTQIESIVDAVVAFYNTIGKFVKAVKEAA